MSKLVEPITYRLKVKSLSDNEFARLTTKDGDTGYDLYALYNYHLAPGEPVRIPHGIAIELPEGYCATIEPRSSNLFRANLVDNPTEYLPLLVQHGEIDNSYRGELMTAVVNLGRFPYLLKAGDRISQLVLRPVIKLPMVTIDELSTTDRGAGGFGSTGA